MLCRKCNFKVDENMKFALMKNICPACGTNLFSDNELNDLSILKNRVVSQTFGRDFSEELAFDISLFVLNEIKNGLGQKYLQQGPRPETEDEDVPTDLDRIRDEVRSEYPEIEALPEKVSGRTVQESRNDRAERLKEVARKSNGGNKAGASVRRVDS